MGNGGAWLPKSLKTWEGMGFSEAVHWWDEWQLRVLVLGSLFLQYFLLIAADLRRRRVPAWFRFLTWLAYLGSDAVAIYALAALFNRHRKHRSRVGLEVLWAPILLVHLGGQDGITAYNIEDNELWMRHILTAVSQVTVAFYVFWKSWPTDKTLLGAVIVVFVPGILKSFERPWALYSASINSLVKLKVQVKDSCADEYGKINSLDEYVQAAVRNAQREGPLGRRAEHRPYNLFVDLQYPYSVRLENLDHTMRCKQGEAHRLVKSALSRAFKRLYTKEQMLYGNEKMLYFSGVAGHRPRFMLIELISGLNRFFSDFAKNSRSMLVELISGLNRFFADFANNSRSMLNQLFSGLNHFFADFAKNETDVPMKTLCGLLVREAAVFLTIAAVWLFHNSHGEAYDDTDVKITYTLLSCTAALEYLTFAAIVLGFTFTEFLVLFGFTRPDDDESSWPEQVAQYNLVGYLARDRKHAWFWKRADYLGCKGILDQLWTMEPCYSSSDITELVHDHVKQGWKDYIEDTDTYRKFNDSRGQLTLERERRTDLESSLRRPFDESVLLWHLATDFCFYHTGASSDNGTARRCRVMSNYMAYLLFVNPEMLMAGTRSRLFGDAYDQLKGMLMEKPQPDETEEKLTQKIIQQVRDTEQEVPPRFVSDAWNLAKALTGSGNKEEMWRVIQGVWVEMLCFSAGRCRGYLHAKSLGKGGEYLSYVWLLLSYMGMDTLAGRLQRTALQEDGDMGSVSPTPAAAAAGVSIV